MNKKKIILITVISVVIILLIAGIIYFIVSNNNKANETPIIETINANLKEKNKYVFSTTFDDNNKVYYAKNQETAYINSCYDGIESKYLVKDGNTYLLQDSQKEYFTYKNNTTQLNKITEQFDELLTQEPTKGEEEVNGKKYNYDEYTGITNLAIQNLIEDEQIDEQNIKTRFYYKNNKLEYMKTIVGDKEELLKIDISYNVDDNLFNIPSDYTEG